MAYDFPASPTTGQVYGAYTYDGEKWLATAANPSLSYVRYDVAQGLPTAQQVVARQNIYAAPFDALAYSGLQINGGVEVSQELGTTGTGTSSKYICDGWMLINTGTAVVGAQQAVSSGFFAGFPNLCQISVSTAQASYTGTQWTGFYLPIEGFRIARLGWGYANPQPITIGFWTAHSVTGTYSVTVTNANATRCYTTTYTQNVANTPEYKTVTIPGCTDGVWNVNNTVGIYLSFALAAGATMVAPSAGNWLSGAVNYVAVSGQVNALNSTSNFCRITGVVILPGIEAPSAARSALIMRPYDQELVTCKRYWQQFPSHVVDLAAPSQTMIFPIEMRANPVITGGGAGFTVDALTRINLLCHQTARALQTLNLDARL